MINLTKTKEQTMNKLYKVKDGDQFKYVLANGSSDREEKIQEGRFLSEVDIRDAEVGSKVIFTSGFAMVDRTDIDLDGMEGVILKKDHYNAIHVKLNKHFSFLDEWDNCIIFDQDAYFDDDQNPIKVVTFKNDEFNYDKIRFTNKKYFYVNWEMQEAKTIDNPYEFFAEDNGFSKDDITMFQEMYVGQRKIVDDMMFDVEILRVK